MIACATAGCGREAVSGPHLLTDERFCEICRYTDGRTDLVPATDTERCRLGVAFRTLTRLVPGTYRWVVGMEVFARYGGLGPWKSLRVSSVDDSTPDWPGGRPYAIIGGGWGTEDTCGDGVDPPDPEPTDLATRSILFVLLREELPMAYRESIGSSADPVFLVTAYWGRARAALNGTWPSFREAPSPGGHS